MKTAVKSPESADCRCELGIFLAETPSTEAPKHYFRRLFPRLRSGHQIFQRPSLKSKFLAFAMIDSLFRVLQSKCLRLLSIAYMAFLPAVASGAVAIGVSSGPLGVGATFPISNSDLVNTASPDLMFFSSTDFGSPTGINDGIFEDSGGGSSGIDETAGQFPALTTFHLNTVANPLGYEISQLRIFTWNTTDGFATLGYEGDFDLHHYIIDYSLVGSTDFEMLATVDISGTDGNNVTWVTLNPVSALTGVDVIRFTWLDPLLTPDSLSLIGEVDIEGSPVTQVPEPSALMLCGIVLGGACFRRNRMSRLLP